MTTLLTAARAVEDQAALVFDQINAERSDAMNKLTLIAEWSALGRVAKALRAAQAIEARRAETATEIGGSVHESAVPKADAQNPSGEE